MPNPLLSIQPPQQAVTPRNALLYAEPQAGEVTPIDAWANVRAAMDAGTDARTYGVQPVTEGMTGRDLMAQYLDPKTGEMTPAGQQYATLPSGFVGSSGGPATTAEALAQRYHPLTLTAEQLGIPGLLERVSTRVPTNKAIANTGHDSATLNVDLASAATDPASFARNGDIINRYGSGFTWTNKGQAVEQPPFMRLAEGSSPQDLHDQLRDHIAGNLRWLWDQAPDVIRERAPLWYDGARTIADSTAAASGLEPRQVAGGIAVMSPATEWNMNNQRFNVTLDTLLNNSGAGLTPEMRAIGQRMVDEKMATGKKGQMKLADEISGMMNSADGGKLQDLSNNEAAWFTRLFQQAHNRDQQVANLAPEGNSLGPVTTKGGKPATFTWGPTDHIENAIRILRNGDVGNISRNTGEAHKVRSFYNNIIAPNARFGDITNDTHAIAGGLLLPLGQDDILVGHGLGGSGSGSGLTGVQGLYPAYADAYRHVAGELGLLPRQLQSVLWETGRGLFSPSAKRNITLRKDIDGVWSDYAAGRRTADEARAAVRGITGPVQDPPWAVSNPR